MQIQCFHTVAFSMLLLLLFAPKAAVQAEGFKWTCTNESASLTEDGMPVLAYQIAMRDKDGKWPRANYVHPLYGMSGQVVTEDFPEDHGHHRGIFWAWHQVLVDGKPLGDAWLCKDFEWDVEDVKADQTQDGVAVLRSKVLWKSPDLKDETGKLVPIAREDVTIRIYKRAPNYRTIDFAIRIQALLEGLQIGGSNDVKGYGGFSPRIKLNANQRFLNLKGEQLLPQKTAIEAGPWVNIADSTSGLAIMQYQRNPATTFSGQPWILRSSGSMQNVVYPGRYPIAIEPPGQRRRSDRDG